MTKRADTTEPRQNSADVHPYGRDFLSRVYRYRQRSDRSPMEDFLTECLTELLNRLSEIKGGVYARELLRLDRVLPKEVEFGPGFRWSSQTAISGVGRPDLVGRGTSKDGEGIYVVVENKVSAGYTGSGDNAQLERYRGHLDQRKEKYKALVLITHWTPLSAQADVVVRWREIAKQLCKWERANTLAEDLIAQALSSWLVDFLKEENMSEIKLDLMDIASVASHRRLIDACRALEPAIQDAVAQLVDSFSKVGLQIPQRNRQGGFRSGDFGTVFYGSLWAPEAKITDNTRVTAWAGIWTGYEIYDITPSVPGVPEISFGIALWGGEKDTGDERVDAMKKILSEVRTALGEENGWKVEGVLEGDYDCVILRKAKPLSGYYEPGVDWNDVVTRFFDECVEEFLKVDAKILRNIAEWDEGKDEDESES